MKINSQRSALQRVSTVHTYVVYRLRDTRNSLSLSTDNAFQTNLPVMLSVSLSTVVILTEFSTSHLLLIPTETSNTAKVTEHMGTHGLMQVEM